MMDSLREGGISRSHLISISQCSGHLSTQSSDSSRGGHVRTVPRIPREMHPVRAAEALSWPPASSCSSSSGEQLLNETRNLLIEIELHFSSLYWIVAYISKTCHSACLPADDPRPDPSAVLSFQDSQLFLCHQEAEPLVWSQ